MLNRRRITSIGICLTLAMFASSLQEEGAATAATTAARSRGAARSAAACCACRGVVHGRAVVDRARPIVHAELERHRRNQHFDR